MNLQKNKDQKMEIALVLIRFDNSVRTYFLMHIEIDEAILQKFFQKFVKSRC